uniref:Uncharacterized protein n=1 Tax=Cacopsylla melanoneura TaxID=428564 RepID=A0A8D9FIH2_9HEMI
MSPILNSIEKAARRTETSPILHRPRTESRKDSRAESPPILDSSSDLDKVPAPETSPALDRLAASAIRLTSPPLYQMRSVHNRVCLQSTPALGVNGLRFVSY